MMLSLPENVNFILDRLNKHGEGFIVGGSVRDHLLGIEPKDYDFCTDLLPDKIKEIFSNFTIIPTGEKHGTITVMISDTPYEITTYRVDGSYSDNRRPDSVEFTSSIEDDLSRRDFTINAMAYNHKEGLVDLFGGQDDLKNRIIKCVGSPFERFEEDPLRMLRAFRFVARFRGKLDVFTSNAIWKLAWSISNTSFERIQSELNKILLYDPTVVTLLFSHGLLYCILPELYLCFDCEQNNPYHSETVGDHIISVTKNTPAKLHLRLAGLLHDIGKPLSKTIDPVTGTDHFYDHQLKSYDLAKSTLKRLKYDNDTTEKVLTLVLHHMDTITPSKRTLRRLLNTLGKEITHDLFDLREADIKAHTVTEQRLDEIYKAEKVLQEIIEANECFSLKDLAINGKDLIELGYKPGKEFGIMLNRLLEKVLENPELNTKEQLIKEIGK